MGQVDIWLKFVLERSTAPSIWNKKLHYFGQVIDQDDGTKFYYFISHSAMRTWEWLDLDKHQVFPSIYEYSYKEWIMDRFIQKHSKFGRYP
ncbi:hypothetical protein [Aggregatibacter actinomycetemcomitans]|uniref:hypothetical protein n=2 Tax=Aggregatibacter actinomycetemcomitans TaxID=714 RepID=UPI0011DDC2DC|nr:hypothetical protein [Aggregatibacter actinomycetemcomitans]QEH48943.1 hypothetical protein FXN57_04195 [Aggregatibacter actinomycetemcomitans]